MRGKWLLIIVGLIALAVAGGALSVHRKRQAEAAPRTGGTAAVIAPSNDVALSGTIRPQHVVNIGATVHGDIESFAVEVGQEVFQGQVLARVGAADLESEREAAAHAVETAQNMVSRAESAMGAARMEASRAQADAQRARATLDRVQKVYQRQQTLFAAGATPALTFRKAEQDFEAAMKDAEIMGRAERAANDGVKATIESLDEAKKKLAEKNEQLDAAQGAMEAAELRAPVDGLVVGRKGEVGKPAEESGDQMFQIATDIYALEVVLDVPPPVLKRIHPGQQALVSVLDLQTGGMPGAVKEVKDKDGQAVVEFNSTVPAIRPGMRAEVRLKFE